MRAVQISASVSRDTRKQREDVLLYSAMSDTATGKGGSEEKEELKHFSPFWAVMLADCDTTKLVNMNAHIEEYACSAPIAKHHGDVKTGFSMSVKIPFLTNKIDLAAGSLLVLPFDADIDEIIKKEFPPLEDEIP